MILKSSLIIDETKTGQFFCCAKWHYSKLAAPKMRHAYLKDLSHPGQKLYKSTWATGLSSFRFGSEVKHNLPTYTCTTSEAIANGSDFNSS